MPHQIEVMQNQPERFKVLVWHRRARKTTTLLEEIRKQSYLRKGIYWIVLPLRKQAKDNIWKDPDMLFRIFDPAEIKKANETELTLYLKNGSTILLHGADQPESLKGGNPIGGGSDEFDTMSMNLWNEVVYPIVNNNGGWWWFTGTPKGKKNLFKLLSLSRDGQKNWYGMHLRGDKSGILTTDQVEEARRTMTEAMFNQEILCDFLEDAGTVFRRIAAAGTAKPQQPNDAGMYVMGVDLAKYQDWTVIVVVDRSTNEEVYRDRFQKIEWPYQKAKIASVAKFYNNARIYIDATGVGDPIADDLMRQGLSVEPIKLSNQSKKEIIEKLAIWIEQGYYKYIDDEQGNAKFELENFTYNMLPSGAVQYSAPDGMHDDEVIAKGLACWALFEKIPERKRREPTIIEIAKARAVRRYESENSGEELEVEIVE
jgi:hypothetical protein